MKKYLKFIKKEKLAQLTLEDKKMPMTQISKINNSLRLNHPNSYDVSAARTSQPLSSNVAVAYFQAFIKKLSPRNQVGVGIIQKDCALKRHPGDSNMSIGYLSSGDIKINSKKYKTFSSYKTSSVVGLGIIYFKNQIFFTLDGQFIDTIPFQYHPDTWSKFYPCISVRNNGDQIQLKFNHFLFNYQEFQSKIEKQYIQQIQKQSITNINIYTLVGDYLKFHGYNTTYTLLKKNHTFLQQSSFISHPYYQCKLGFADASNVTIKQKKYIQQKQDELILQRKCSTRQRIMSDYWGDISAQPRKRIYSNQFSLLQRKNSLISNMSNQQQQTKNKKNSAQPQHQDDHSSDQQNQKQKFLLQTRITILKLIRQQQIQAAQQLLQHTLPKIFQLFSFLKLYFQMHIYLRLLKNDTPNQAMRYMQTHSPKYHQFKQQLYPLYSCQQSRLKFVSFTCMMGLISHKYRQQPDIITSAQFQAFANYLNQLILKNMGMYPQSRLDILVNHLNNINSKNQQFQINGLSFLCDV